MDSPENPNLLFDFDYILKENLTDTGGDLLLPPLDPPGLTWHSHSLLSPTALRVDREDAFANSEDLKETGYRKRFGGFVSYFSKPGGNSSKFFTICYPAVTVAPLQLLSLISFRIIKIYFRIRSPSCNASGSKACREKIRRDKLNDRFLELASILGSGRPPKMDKVSILGDAVRMVNQLRVEAQKLKGSNEELQEKINELKAEKNERRQEKQMLKTEKDSLEVKIKGLLYAQPGFMHPPAMAASFSGPGQFVGSKFVPFIGYPGVSMWQFMPSNAVDTSQDHFMRPPAA